MTHRASQRRASKIRGRRANLLLLTQERSKGLLLRMGFRDGAVIIKAKAKVGHPKMGGILGLLCSHGRGHVFIATSLDTRNGIILRGRDPRVMGHLSLSHQWDVRRLSFRVTSISLRVLHMPLLFHNQVGWAKAWVEVEARAHRSGLWGPRGVSTLLHLRLSLQISQSFKVHSYSLAYEQGYCLILVHLIHSL